jgi:hypothetical protein
MNPHTISLLICSGEVRPASRAASQPVIRVSLPPVIPSEAGRFSLPLSLLRKRRPAESRNLSYGLYCGGSVGSLSGRSVLEGGVGFGAGFVGGVFGFAQPEHAFAGAARCAPAFPTVKYLRILSRRFGPRPRIASKSSTLLNAPYVFRICKILLAVTGPIPGTCCNSSDVAVLRLTGCAGGFFFPASAADENNRPMKRIGRKNRTERSREVITGIEYSR